jgi:hypothetical protein
MDEAYFRDALAEAKAECPLEVDLVVGLSYGGILAPFLEVPQRRSVCSPWKRLPPATLGHLGDRPGWAVLQGGLDTLVTPDHLEVLPVRVPRQLDAEGTHQFDAWMPRIAVWAMGAGIDGNLNS